MTTLHKAFCAECGTKYLLESDTDNYLCQCGAQLTTLKQDKDNNGEKHDQANK